MNPTASPSPSSATRTATRRLGPAALAAVTALGLTACGSDPEPETAGAPIVLSSTGVAGESGATASATPSPSGATPSGTASPTASGGAAPVAAVVRDDRANVDVEDQGGTGRSVQVEEVRLSAGTGHVVVIDPRTREVLGSVLVGAGTARDVTLTLAQPVTRSGELLALMYADDGDGRFDPATDGAVVDDDDLEPVDGDFDYTLR